jgi:hypothetical protein
LKGDSCTYYEKKYRQHSFKAHFDFTKNKQSWYLAYG